ncbi:chromosome-associated kinesin KIF4A-like [Amphibalanus amphitrite]|uniref:chromosome-associated kinesin KIF4A-like n=1 Tax=Amphibalanus amphitrite TaxID=1232801 RepID=UPI001C90642B|nr:chromosome-associated kinesin KIF4A-like [Amphibalanus amphitrite]
MLIFDPRQQDEDFYFQGVRQRQRDLNKRASKDMQYMFDRVFHPHHSNQQLFEATTKDVIDTVIDGFNCSVFAYGSTGAGKTHTMLGTSSEPGIIFLTVMELYSRIAAMADTRCQVAVSYVEVYNETVTDLLQPSGPLDVREDGQRAVVIAGLSQQTPDGPEHLMAILAAGNQRRTQHPTDMNAESSRSHAVFQVTLRQSDGTAGLSQDVRVSKLSLIDLAGSERGSATGHKGARFREGANINRSLLALGSCINALADGKKFVPYRDSKLTRLLKDSIGGNCKTVMIANVTPSAASFEDTHNTLKYADRAKAIKTRLQRNVVSVDMHVAQYAKVVDELRQEVTELRAQLAERPAADQTAPPPAEPPFDAAPRLEQARGELAAAVQTAEAEAGRAPAGPATDQLVDQLEKERQLDECRSSLSVRQLDECRSSLSVAVAVSAGGLSGGVCPPVSDGPVRCLTALSGVRPQRQLDECRSSLSVRQLDECRSSLSVRQLDECRSSLSVRQLDECRVHAAHLETFSRLLQLELASSDHLLAQLIGAVREQHRVLTYMKFVTPELEAQYKEVVGLVEGQKEVCWADQQQPAADSPGQPSYDVTALLRLADTTYRPAEPLRQATGGLLLSAPAPAPAHPVFFDAEPGPETPRPGGPPEADAVAETETSPGPVQADRDLAEEAVTVPSPREPGPHRAQSPAAEPAAPRTDATVSITPQTGTAGSVTPQTETLEPATPQTETARPATPQTETARPATLQAETAGPVTPRTDAAVSITPQTETAEPATQQVSGGESERPDTLPAGRRHSPAGDGPRVPAGRADSPPAGRRHSPAGDGTRVSAGRADSPPAPPGSPAAAGGTPATEPRRPEAGARHSVSPNLNTTITMSPSESRLASPNVDLGATVAGPAPPASRKAPAASRPRPT